MATYRADVTALAGKRVDKMSERSDRVASLSVQGPLTERSDRA